MSSAPKIMSVLHSSMPELSGGADVAELGADGAKEGFLEKGGGDMSRAL